MEITERTFTQSNGGQIILDWVKKGRKIPEDYLGLILALPNRGEILLEYVKRGHILSRFVQMKIADWQNSEAVVILREYIKRGHIYCGKDLSKIIDRLDEV